MKTTTSLLESITEGIDLSCMLILAFPMAFPIVGWLDGAGDHYGQLSILFMIGALFALMPVFALLQGLSTFLASIERDARERQETTRSLHRYLMDGGRA